MTVRAERTLEVDATPEAVWSFIADAEKRAMAISVVTDFELEDPDGRHARWLLQLPIPLIGGSVIVETEDVTRRPPEYVEFVGKSKLFDVVGEHDVTETEDGSMLSNRFVVDGKVPGVERFFKHNLDDEITNLGRALERDLETKS